MRRNLVGTLALLGIWFSGLTTVNAQEQGATRVAKLRPVFDSPEVVFRAAQRAVASDDWSTLVSLASPDLLNSLGRNGVLWCTVFYEVPQPGGFNFEGFSDGPRFFQKFIKLPKNHKLPSEKLRAVMQLERLEKTDGANGEKMVKLLGEIFGSLSDRHGFVADYIAAYQLWPIFSTNGRAEVKKSFVSNTLVRLEINGEKASGYLVFGITIDKELYFTRDCIEFERVNGSWLISRFPDYFPHA